jgi:hypothetical protein
MNFAWHGRLAHAYAQNRTGEAPVPPKAKPFLTTVILPRPFKSPHLQFSFGLP